MLRIIGSAIVTAILCGAAHAQLVEEVRFGVTQHNICVSDCNNANKEDGPNINAEIVFDSPDFMSLLLSPRPYIMGSLNTSGDTSFGAAGLQWDFEVFEGWSIEPGIGYSIHDGELESPFPQGDPRGDALTQNKVLLGSRDLFRSSLAITRDLGEHWRVQLMYEHLSHGQIIGDGRNQGLDNIGLRLAYRFGE